MNSQTEKPVFVAVTSVLENAISRGEWHKARVCLSILKVIAAKRTNPEP